jgi:hypothetical protein
VTRRDRYVRALFAERWLQEPAERDRLIVATLTRRTSNLGVLSYLRQSWCNHLTNSGSASWATRDS